MIEIACISADHATFQGSFGYGEKYQQVGQFLQKYTVSHFSYFSFEVAA